MDNNATSDARSRREAGHFFALKALLRHTPGSGIAVELGSFPVGTSSSLNAKIRQKTAFLKILKSRARFQILPRTPDIAQTVNKSVQTVRPRFFHAKLINSTREDDVMSLLMQLKSMVAKPSRRRNKRESSCPGLEALESRALMTASGILAADFASSGGIARIINGTVTSQYASVGKVGDASDYYGSGTLIAPQYVLTAGHCAEGVSDTGGRVFINGQEYKTSKVYLHPNYNVNLLGEDAANDIAIFKLDRPVTGVTPSPIFRGTPTVGQLLTLVGFGYGGTGTSGSDGNYGTKRVGTTPIDTVSARLISWNFTENTESNTAPGDSGGPAFVSVGGISYVAGVTSGGDQDNAGLGDHSFDTRVDAFATWIDSIIGSSAPAITVSVKATDANAAETLAGQAANPGQYVLTRTGDTSSPLTVNLLIKGTATAGSDYNSLSTSVTIPSGSSSITIPLTVKDDTLAESAETVLMSVAAGTGYSLDPAATSATVSIADNDGPKSNNQFANRTVLSGTSVQTTGTNVGATRESGEPVHAGVTGGKSVWWKWTATSSGPVTVSTAGSSFDTTLGVYRGSAVSALSGVASNDDENYDGDIYTSKLTFNAVAGTTYQIAVDGFYGESGSIRLSLQQSSTRSTPARNSAATGSRTLSFNDHRAASPVQHRIHSSLSSTGLRITAGGRFSSSRRPFHGETGAPIPPDSATEEVFSNCLSSILDGLGN